MVGSRLHSYTYIGVTLRTNYTTNSSSSTWISVVQDFCVQKYLYLLTYLSGSAFFELHVHAHMSRRPFQSQHVKGLLVHTDDTKKEESLQLHKQNPVYY